MISLFLLFLLGFLALRGGLLGGHDGIDELGHVDVLGQFEVGLGLLEGRALVAEAVDGGDGVVAHLLGTSVEGPAGVGHTGGEQVLGLGDIDGVEVGAIDII